MKHKHPRNFFSPRTTSTKKAVVTMLVIGALFFQPLLFGNVVYAQSASSGIAGKCVTEVLKQKGIAFAAGGYVAAIGAALTAGQTALAVPSNDRGVSSGANLQSGEGTATTILSWMKPMTDCMVHEASQLMIDYLKTTVTTAIRDGLHGSPNYSALTNQYLARLSDMVTGQLRRQIDGLALCDFTGDGSLKTNLSNGIAGSGQQNQLQTFNQKVECPFPAGFNTKNFYKDFNKGGWSAFEKSLSNNGNSFGATLITGRELVARQSQTTNLAEKQLTQGAGYFPVIDETTCAYPPGVKAYLDAEGDATALADAQRLYCKVTTPGKAVADTASKSVTSAWDQLNISGALGKTMQGFASEQAANAMKGAFK